MPYVPSCSLVKMQSYVKSLDPSFMALWVVDLWYSALILLLYGLLRLVHINNTGKNDMWVLVLVK